jgi:GTP cyclohydrolase I
VRVIVQKRGFERGLIISSGNSKGLLDFPRIVWRSRVYDEELLRGLSGLILRNLPDNCTSLPTGMIETPERVIRMFEELTRGYRVDVKSLFKVFEEETDEMVIVRGHHFVSLCEHHLAIFEGVATVGYIPKNGRVVGLSKLARLVDCFANRFQIQERMTKQIADSLVEYLNPEGCGVVIVARHSCMSCRGVGSSTSETVTSAVRGVFKEDARAREEFLLLSQIGK